MEALFQGFCKKLVSWINNAMWHKGEKKFLYDIKQGFSNLIHVHGIERFIKYLGNKQ